MAHARRAGAGDAADPAGHADERGDVPAARPAGHLGGAGRPDERRPGGARHRVGIPFPGLWERFDRYEEQLAVITGLWNTPPGETFDFAGQHYRLEASPALPEPVQIGGIPVLVGGSGKKRTPRLAARYAREFNVRFASAEENARLFAGVGAACEEAGRDPASMIYSSALVVCVGKDEAELTRRAAAIGREPHELRRHGVAGTPGEAVEVLGR